MQNTTPIFPGFHLPTLRRKGRTPQQKLADKLAQIQSKSLTQLDEVLGRFIPSSAIRASESGTFSRHRLYSAANTFWAFMGQVLSTDGGCQEVVRKIQAYAAAKGEQCPSSSTAAYCKARGKLDPEKIEQIFRYTAMDMDPSPTFSGPWDRRVIVIDGTGFSMPDTQANQEVWPQPSQQKTGCGFPLGKLVGCFSLQTGGLLRYETGNKHDHELSLFRRQWDIFKNGDIALADKGFCNYRDVALLLNRGVDSVMSLRRKPFKNREVIKRLGGNEVLVRWKRPARIKGYSKEEWDQLPRSIVVRQIHIRVENPGFRTQEIYLLSTLTDPDIYTAESLAEVYFQRWDVELFFRDIKITMGMDILRCKTPKMILKELNLHLIAYNCIRRLIVEAGEKEGTPIRKISFKGALQALCKWEPHLNQTHISKRDRLRMIRELYACIAQNKLPNRPGRSEPRAKKRRPKNHRLLTKPRHEMSVPNHRNRNWENICKVALS